MSVRNPRVTGLADERHDNELRDVRIRAVVVSVADAPLQDALLDEAPGTERVGGAGRRKATGRGSDEPTRVRCAAHDRLARAVRTRSCTHSPSIELRRWRSIIGRTFVVPGHWNKWRPDPIFFQQERLCWTLLR